MRSGARPIRASRCSRAYRPANASSHNACARVRTDSSESTRAYVTGSSVSPGFCAQVSRACSRTLGSGSSRAAVSQAGSCTCIRSLYWATDVVVACERFARGLGHGCCPSGRTDRLFRGRTPAAGQDQHERQDRQQRMGWVRQHPAARVCSDAAPREARAHWRVAQVLSAREQPTT